MVKIRHTFESHEGTLCGDDEYAEGDDDDDDSDDDDSDDDDDDDDSWAGSSDGSSQSVPSKSHHKWKPALNLWQLCSVSYSKVSQIVSDFPSIWTEFLIFLLSIMIWKKYFLGGIFIKIVMHTTVSFPQEVGDSP